MRSNMVHQFDKVPSVNIERSVFDLSHSVKTTGDFGIIYPLTWWEVLPGDSFTVDVSMLGRLATLLKPPMDNMYIDIHCFYVNNRLVWDHWKNFMGEKENPGDSTVYTVPQMTGPSGAGILVGSLSDYLGLPTGIASITFNSLIHRCYNLIWNEWYRPEWIEDSAVVDKDDGADTYTDYVLRRRYKRLDYFTSALPWPQAGVTGGVTLPLGSTAPVIPNDSSSVPLFKVGNSSTHWMVAANPTGVIGLDSVPNITDQMQWGFNVRLKADLSNATAATVNAVRLAFQLQKMYEKDARYGVRLPEIIKGHFLIDMPYGQWRSEYLGGGTVNIMAHPVAQTSETVDSPQGNLAGFATAGGSGIGFTKSFFEHGHILILWSARADLTYQQGMEKKWFRRTRFDFYWPGLAHVGEQEVTSKELYCDGTSGDDNVFGYVPRYDEYRFGFSKITGIFRSTYATSLDFWHLSQEFGSRPSLNGTFLREDPPVDRVIAVPSEPHLIIDSYIKVKAARPMPTYAVPGLIDHF